MRSVAIIGGGFSGTMVGVHLLRRALRGQTSVDHVLLFERSNRIAGGVAYGTDDPRHLLNVPAGRMSAFEDDPDNFLRWLRTRDPRVSGGSFIPRKTYGEYIATLFRDTLAAASSAQVATSVDRVRDEVVRVEPGAAERWRVVTRAGASHEVSSVLLAIGHFAPPPLGNDDATRAFEAGPLFARNAWSAEALDVAPDRDVLLVGTGLTMFDLALSLHGRGHRGTVWAISRRGLLAQAHRVSSTPPRPYPRPRTLDSWPATALGYLRGLRREVELGADQGIDWREVVTSIRHDTPAMWARLSPRERARFLRHVRPFWESHRHRASPETAAVVDAMTGSGALRVLAGRIVSMREERVGAEACAVVTVRERATGAAREIRCAKVINCTGPDTDLTRVQDPLVQHLRWSGLIRPDELGLGLDSDDSGCVIDARGQAQPGLYLVGPLRKGKLWENTAVPELRNEVERMATTLSGVVVRTPGARARV